jgi:putative Mg2+ transporter-C (MgtC) family protein
MDILTENIIRVCMAVLAGGVIGAEREFHDKAAGFRTIILITIGSTLFTVFSIAIDPENSRTRIAANIVTGIGFLGAGAIVRDGGRIAGLTTAATIWLAAALGMGIGAGDLWLVGAATMITMFVLLVFPRFEGWIDRIRESRSYRIVVANDGKLEEINETLKGLSLRVLERHIRKSQGETVATWRVIGKPKDHERFVEATVKDEEVKELDY